MKNIYQTVFDIMAELDPIGKDSKSNQGFKYRGIDAVMNALGPLFAKHRLCAVPEVLEQSREERQSSKGGLLIYSIVRMKYTFIAEDGSSVAAVVIGEGMDSGDKATNKAMSIAFKYACFQLFCIPTEETHPDPDKEVQDVEPKKAKTNPKPAEPKKAAPAEYKAEAKTQVNPEREAIKTEVISLAGKLGMTPMQLAQEFGLNQDTKIERFEAIKDELTKRIAEAELL